MPYGVPKYLLTAPAPRPATPLSARCIRTLQTTNDGNSHRNKNYGMHQSSRIKSKQPPNEPINYTIMSYWSIQFFSTSANKSIPIHKLKIHTWSKPHQAPPAILRGPAVHPCWSLSFTTACDKGSNCWKVCGKCNDVVMRRCDQIR